MKIAREIAEALFPINTNMRLYNSETTKIRKAQREAAFPIIAAKLEHIREAFTALVKENQRIAIEDAADLHDCAYRANTNPHDVLQFVLPKATQALALFDEDSLTSDSVEQLIDSEAREGERVAAQIYTAIHQHKLDHESYPRLIKIGAGVAMCFPDTYNSEPCYSREDGTMFGIHVMFSLMDGWELIC